MAGTGFHHRSIFGPVVAVTLVVIGLAWAAGPEIGPASVVIVLVVIALLGIPHGALDHLVAARVDPTGARSPATRLRFHRNYLLAMVGVGLVWLAAPPVALAGFLLLSVHHFGQSDLAHLGLPRRRQLAVQWSRGLFLVGLPLLAHVTTVAPLVEQLGGGDPATWTWLTSRTGLVVAVLIGQHVIVGAAVARHAADAGTLAREMLSVTVLATLFLVADPLVGFAVYFGLWHSLAHLLVLADELVPAPARNERLRHVAALKRVARLAAPLTIASLIGLAGLAGVLVAIGRADLVLAAVFVVVSMLTVPHLVVVERLWRRRAPSGRPPHDPRHRLTLGVRAEA